MRVILIAEKIEISIHFFCTKVQSCFSVYPHMHTHTPAALIRELPQFIYINESL